jgi:hypothetical protein
LRGVDEGLEVGAGAGDEDGDLGWLRHAYERADRDPVVVLYSPFLGFNGLVLVVRTKFS